MGGKVNAQLHQDHECECSRPRMRSGSSEAMYPMRSHGITAGRLPGGSETEKASESEPRGVEMVMGSGDCGGGIKKNTDIWVLPLQVWFLLDCGGA